MQVTPIRETDASPITPAKPIQKERERKKGAQDREEEIANEQRGARRVEKQLGGVGKHTYNKK